MRLQARKPILLRGRPLGGEMPLVCIPLVAADEQSLKEEAEKIVGFKPDVIEWRVDNFDGVFDAERVKKVLAMLRRIIGDIPMIFTCRSHLEGGFKEIDDEIKFSMIKKVLVTGHIDVVDIEIINGRERIDEIKAAAHKGNTALILSYHNFKETPETSFIVDRLRTAILYGADIAKVAVMPQNESDVLKLLEATLFIRTEYPDVPIITMAMGGLGVITRMAGWIFGSDLTFAVGQKASAPGQIPVADLRKGIEILMRSSIQ